MLIIAAKAWSPDISEDSIINNVEAQFYATPFENTDKIKRIVSDIEQGDLISNTAFIDRFGYKLSIGELSTGCKALILLEVIRDKFINFAEVGLNARSYAIRHFSSGCIILPNFLYEIEGDASSDIEVGIHGTPYLFRNLGELSYYINNDMGDKFSIDYNSVTILDKSIE